MLYTYDQVYLQFTPGICGQFIYCASVLHPAISCLPSTKILMCSLTLAHRSSRWICSLPFLTSQLLSLSPLSTGQWWRALREWYTARNSTCCRGVQKWGIRSWRGKKYLAVIRRGWQQRDGWWENDFNRDRTGGKIQYIIGYIVLFRRI